VGHPQLGKVRHTLEHDRQPYYVVDSNLLYHMLPSRHGRVMLLHPLKKLKSRIALAVDSIERMLTLSRILPLPCAFSGEERLWYRGLAVVDGNVIPVVDPAAILSEAEMMVLDASMETRLAMAGGAR
jgi:chemotaxis signal transduction protein